jgi:hypothetical protein
LESRDDNRILRDGQERNQGQRGGEASDCDF